MKGVRSREYEFELQRTAIIAVNIAVNISQRQLPLRFEALRCKSLPTRSANASPHGNPSLPTSIEEVVSERPSERFFDKVLWQGSDNPSTIQTKCPPSFSVFQFCAKRNGSVVIGKSGARCCAIYLC